MRPWPRARRNCADLFLADQQNKHSNRNQQTNQTTDGQRQSSGCDDQAASIQRPSALPQCQARRAGCPLSVKQASNQLIVLNSSSCMATIVSRYRTTIAMMNSIHDLLSENHPCTLFMVSLHPGYHDPPNAAHYHI